jgi:hypothetical protein
MAMPEYKDNYPKIYTTVRMKSLHKKKKNAYSSVYSVNTIL